MENSANQSKTPRTESELSNLKNNLLSMPAVLHAEIENDGRDIFVALKEDDANREVDHKEKTKIWSRLFDTHYEKISTSSSAELNTQVWMSSYNGQSINSEEMNEWIQSTAERIFHLNSKDARVLELGCGNGLILASIIENITSYVGMDSSENAIHCIQAAFKDRKDGEKITLFHGDALELDKIPKAEFDIIVINSVAQYFPNLDYLLTVINKLKPYCANESVIFLGDLRSLPHAPVFTTDILAHRLAKETSVENFWKSFSQLKNRERETLYDPRLFALLPRAFPWITSVKTELKRGSHHNEMSMFRYDATLFCNNKNVSHPMDMKYFDWEKDQLNLELVEKIFKNETSFEISNIPNLRILHATEFYKTLQQKNMQDPIQEKSATSHGIDPEQLWQLGGKNSWNTEVDWDLASGLDRISVRFLKSPNQTIQSSPAQLKISEMCNKLTVVGEPSQKQKEIADLCKVPLKFVSQDVFKLL